MASLEKTLRNQLERAVKEARDIAEAGAKAALETLGVGDAGPPSYLDDDQRNLRRRLRIHGRQLGDLSEEKKKTQEIERLTEEVAYEHWHRMLFARFLAENNLLMYPDPHSPVAVSLTECEDLAADDGARNGWELAARFAARMLPQIFRVDSPVFELELPPERQQQLEKLISYLPLEVFTASDSLGWVYQFWQANRKKQINESEVKIGARELPAVTQLFTEDYMVAFLLDNTLGAWYAGKALATNPALANTAQSEVELRQSLALPGCPWAYLRFVKSEDNDWTPAAGTFEGWPKAVNDLKCLDPCMGSGHFVVAMFERLVALRMAEEQLDETVAVAVVIRDNLFGLEIDPRCTQIAAFNLALAAWRRVGYCILPPMNLACSGLAPNTSKEEWLALAGGDEKLQNGMERLFELFEKAPVLGSLINPRAEKGDLLEAAFHQLQPLLEKAFSQEASTEHRKLNAENFLEMAVTARGLAKAAEILAGQFTLVATNVPYLGRGKQSDYLKNWAEENESAARADLSTMFISRSLTWIAMGGSIAVVSPQNWFFLKGYNAFRQRILKDAVFDFISNLGEEGWQAFGDRGPRTALICCSNQTPLPDQMFFAIDASTTRGQQILDIPDKMALLAGDCTALSKDALALGRSYMLLRQLDQCLNPDQMITLSPPAKHSYLSEWADCYQGISTGDNLSKILFHWELQSPWLHWLPLQGPPSGDALFAGRDEIIQQKLLDDNSTASAIRGRSAWGKSGVALALTGVCRATPYLGELFPNAVPVIIPKRTQDLIPILAFCASNDYQALLRIANSKVAVDNGYATKVPFDLAHWQQVAAEKYPHGLPKPFSSDPTQWLFNGHPHGSDNPLQVAVARLVGYKWPRQTGSSFPDCPALGPDGLESFSDKDGIVCIPPVRGETGAADRLLNLLAAAYGNEWNSEVLGRLLSDAGYAGKSLEAWLRDGFFQQHCELFHQRPFVWHIWDGLRDGFSALVNYHKLDRKNLETLIYTYLGDWITRCEAQDKDSGLTEDGEKTTSAKSLKRKLELILAGEAPYDIFVRWKPLHQQPIGWEPDINDGVRMNIRPFVSVPDVKVKGAGILRVKPKIKWEKDRGREPERSKEDFPWFWGWDGKTTDFPGGPEFKGERFNDCHYTLAKKRTARSSAAH